LIFGGYPSIICRRFSAGCLLANKTSETAPLCRLRASLEGGIDDAQTIIRRLREAGVLPHGGSGRNGVHSARVGVREAALILLAIGCRAWTGPANASAEACRLADFRLDGHGEKLIDVFAGTIAGLAAGVDGCDASWSVSRRTVRQLQLGWTFSGSDEPPDRDHVTRWTVIPAGLVSDIGAIFRRPEGRA
jgi:hypothetical protein